MKSKGLGGSAIPRTIIVIMFLCAICLFIVGCKTKVEMSENVIDDGDLRSIVAAPSAFGNQLGAIHTSADCKHVLYNAMQDGKCFIVVDGKIVSEKRYNGAGTPVASADGKRLAFTVREGNKWFVVIDGQAQKQYDDVADDGGPIFSPDNKRVAYIAKEDGKEFIVVDGIEGKHYDGAWMPVFSPDGKRFAFDARTGNKSFVAFVVVDGQESKGYKGVGAQLFSPNGNRLAFLVGEDGKQFMVVDGQEQKRYDGISKNGAVFSPDNVHLAYLAREGNKQFIVVDRKEEGQNYAGLGDPVFSQDGKRMAYIASRDNNKGFVVVDGQEGKHYDLVGNPVFSPDSKRIAYVAVEGESLFVVVDGKEGKHYDNVFWNGGIIARGKLSDPTTGKEIKLYDKACTPVFSPDSKRIVYAAWSADNQFVVVDGVEGKRFSKIAGSGIISNPTGASIVFDSPDRFHYLALDNKRVILVENTIKNSLF